MLLPVETDLPCLFSGKTIRETLIQSLLGLRAFPFLISILLAATKAHVSEKKRQGPSLQGPQAPADPPLSMKEANLLFRALTCSRLLGTHFSGSRVQLHVGGGQRLSLTVTWWMPPGGHTVGHMGPRATLPNMLPAKTTGPGPCQIHNLHSSHCRWPR